MLDDAFWRDSTQDKSTDPLLCQALEQRARSEEPMRGFSLRKCQLAGIDLVRRGNGAGYDLSGTDLSGANLQGAHLFAAGLRGASLMKADLRHANLHCADLRDANLLGVKLEGAKLNNVRWGEQVLQERQAMAARKAGQRQAMVDLLQESEEIYRNLRLSLELAGLFEQAGYFLYREMVMRRLLMPRGSMRRAFSWVVDLFCGYGEQPWRVVLFSVGLVLTCAVLYFMLGLRYGDTMLALAMDQDFSTNIVEFLSCIYFSVVTFTTVGYGDIVPLGPSRLLAAVEAFLGSFTMALFVVVFVKKMTR